MIVCCDRLYKYWSRDCRVDYRVNCTLRKRYPQRLLVSVHSFSSIRWWVSPVGRFFLRVRIRVRDGMLLSSFILLSSTECSVIRQSLQTSIFDLSDTTRKYCSEDQHVVISLYPYECVPVNILIVPLHLFAPDARHSFPDTRNFQEYKCYIHSVKKRRYGVLESFRHWWSSLFSCFSIPICPHYWNSQSFSDILVVSQIVRGLSV